MLIYIPILLFVAGFLYETYLSFRRMGNVKKGQGTYVDVTWEITHTLLVFGVVMMVMLFTKHIDRIAELILVPTFLAMLALFIRGACYMAIFYMQTARIKWLDWVFALSHVVAALLLVVVVLIFSTFLIVERPSANLQFIPAFLTGLVGILAITIVPIVVLYRYRK